MASNNYNKIHSLLAVVFVAVSATIALPGGAGASIISADFRLELDLPDNVLSSGPRVFENLGVALIAGDELTPANEIANPSGWAGAARIGLSSGGLVTLTGDQEGLGFADYDFARFSITNIVFSAGQSITSVTSLLAGLLDPNYELGQIPPSISFTTNSVEIFFDTTGGGAFADFQFLDGGVSTFQLDFGTSAPIPLPAAGWLLLGGLGVLAAAKRRRRTA